MNTNLDAMQTDWYASKTGENDSIIDLDTETDPDNEDQQQSS